MFRFLLDILVRQIFLCNRNAVLKEGFLLRHGIVPVGIVAVTVVFRLCGDHAVNLFLFVFLSKCGIDDCVKFRIGFFLQALCSFQLFDMGSRFRLLGQLFVLRSGFLGFAHQIDRAVLDLKIGLAEVQAEDARAEHLQAAEEHDAAGRRRITERIPADNQTLDDRKDQQDQAKQAGDKADDRRCGERCGRKTDDALQRITEQAPEAPCACSGGTLDVFIFQILHTEADP